MLDPVREVKTRAEILHRRVQAGDAAALARLRALGELARATEAELAEAAARMRRAHCLTVVARELGFTTWEHARRVLDGDLAERDVGTLLYGDGARGTLNAWFVDHDEAKRVVDDARRAGGRRYLLAWRTHLFVVEAGFIEAMGLDPDDPDWEAIDFDWAKPRDVAARRRLYAKLLGGAR